MPFEIFKFSQKYTPEGVHMGAKIAWFAFQINSLCILTDYDWWWWSKKILLKAIPIGKVRKKKSIVYFDAYILEQLLPCLRMNGYKIKHTNNNKRVKPDRPTEIMLLICCVVNSKTLILSQKEVKSVLSQVTSYHVVFTNVYLYHQMNLWNENQQLN